MGKNKFSFFILLFFLLVQANILRSQSLQTIPKIGLGINGVDFSIEIPVDKKITIEPAVGVGPTYKKTDWDEYVPPSNEISYFDQGLHVSMYGKYLYNRNRRLNKGKSLHLNSGNFIGMKVWYVSKPFNNEEYLYNTILVNLNWGGQRNIGRYWIYSYSLGLGWGYNIDIPYDCLHLAIDLKMAYVLPFLSKK